jgi:hypothetical protein
MTAGIEGNGWKLRKGEEVEGSRRDKPEETKMSFESGEG